MVARKINLDQFREAGVCSDGFIHFAGAFGSEVEVTEENCRRMAGKLNFAFGADVFLKGAQRVEFQRRMVEWNERAKYRWEMARDNYYDALNNRVSLIMAVAAREMVEAPLRREGEIAQALAFCYAYNMEE